MHPGPGDATGDSKHIHGALTAECWGLLAIAGEADQQIDHLFLVELRPKLGHVATSTVCQPAERPGNRGPRRLGISRKRCKISTTHC
jgi:hypothetical protein